MQRWPLSEAIRGGAGVDAAPWHAQDALSSSRRRGSPWSANTSATEAIPPSTPAMPPSARMRRKRAGADQLPAASLCGVAALGKVGLVICGNDAIRAEVAAVAGPPSGTCPGQARQKARISSGAVLLAVDQQGVRASLGVGRAGSASSCASPAVSASVRATTSACRRPAVFGSFPPCPATCRIRHPISPAAQAQAAVLGEGLVLHDHGRRACGRVARHGIGDAQAFTASPNPVSMSARTGASCTSPIARTISKCVPITAEDAGHRVGRGEFEAADPRPSFCYQYAFCSRLFCIAVSRSIRASSGSMTAGHSARTHREQQPHHPPRHATVRHAI